MTTTRILPLSTQRMLQVLGYLQEEPQTPNVLKLIVAWTVALNQRGVLVGLTLRPFPLRKPYRKPASMGMAFVRT